MEYSAQRQAGSVVVYVLVGVLLAAVAVGAIIMAQNRGGQQDVSQPAVETPPTPVSQNNDKKAADTQQADKAAKDKMAAEDKAAKEKAQAEAKKQAEDKLTADKKAAEDKAAAKKESQQVAVATDGPMARTGGSQAGTLPTTGPAEDALGIVVGLVAIAGAGYFYYHFGRRG